MQDTAVVIMAAGMGSRYGGMKQIEPVGPGGEIILDYSVHDALEAGFNRVILIIRKDLEKEFHRVIGERLEKKVKVEYVFQDMDDLPEGFAKPEGRIKPWGTGHAILSCRDVVREPFVVINADDYYGKTGFSKIHEYLCRTEPSDGKWDICMAGFRLGNTLSENGTVTRGVCEVKDGMLLDIMETPGIAKGDGFAVTSDKRIPFDQPVSMNMWGYRPDLIPELERRFIEFLKSRSDGDITSEYLLPNIVQDMLRDQTARVRVLETPDRWFGVTYQEDKMAVIQSFQQLVKEGVYPERLYA